MFSFSFEISPTYVSIHDAPKSTIRNEGWLKDVHKYSNFERKMSAKLKKLKNYNSAYNCLCSQNNNWPWVSSESQPDVRMSISHLAQLYLSLNQKDQPDRTKSDGSKQ